MYKNNYNHSDPHDNVNRLRVERQLTVNVLYLTVLYLAEIDF